MSRKASMEAERKSHSVSMSSLRLKTTAPKEIKNELRTIKRKKRLVMENNSSSCFYNYTVVGAGASDNCDKSSQVWSQVPGHCSTAPTILTSCLTVSRRQTTPLFTLLEISWRIKSDRHDWVYLLK